MNQSLIFRNRNFRLVWLGQVFSQAGSRAYFMNLLWWMVTQADGWGQQTAVVWSGVLLALTGLPSLVFVKWIGGLLERVPSRVLMIRSELIAALAVGVLFLFEWNGKLSPAIVLITSFIVAVCQAVVDPTLTKSVPEIVETEDIEAAVGFESSTQALAFFAGAAMGAVASSAFGFRATVCLNILTYLLSSLFTYWARFKPTASDESSAAAVGDAALESTPLPRDIQPLLTSFAAANCFMFPIFLILPLFVRAHLTGGILSLGYLEACFWLGLVVGAFSAQRITWQRSLLKLCAAAYGSFGLLLAGLYFSKTSIWPACVLALGGFSAGMINVKVINHFQLTLPSTAKPTFFARLQAYVGASQPLSYLLFTGILAVVSPEASFVVCGAGLVVVALFCVGAAHTR